MGDFIIECFENGNIDYATARAVIMRDCPEWELELDMARELMVGG